MDKYLGLIEESYKIRKLEISRYSTTSNNKFLLKQSPVFKYVTLWAIHSRVVSI